MVIHYLTGNTKATPYLLFKWAYEHGYYIGSCLDHGAVSAMGKLCGVKGKWIGKDGKKIVKALLTGHPVIAHMGPDTFTKGGHYIVLQRQLCRGQSCPRQRRGWAMTNRRFGMTHLA